MKTKLFVIIPSLRVGGAERFSTTLLRHLDRDRFDITLVLIQDAGALVGDVPPDIPIRQLGKTSVRAAIIALVRLIRRERPDIVFSTLGHLNLAIAMTRGCFHAGTRCIARAAASPAAEYTRLPGWLRDHLVRRHYPQLDVIVAQSAGVADDLTQRYGIPDAMIQTIPNPVDDRHILTLAGSPPPRGSGDGVRLVAAGRLEYQKGFDLLLDAFRQLPEQFELEILGDGPERPALEAVILQSGLEKRCRLRGFVTNPFAVFLASDLLVFCSRYDAFPNTVLEAGICGLPTVGFRCPGGITEIVRDGSNGFLVPAEDSDALAGAIRKAATHRFDRTAIQTTTANRFGTQRIIPLYESLLLHGITAKPDSKASEQPRP